MNKIRDFIYNTSDIVITLIIIAAAAFLIFWRVDIISQYSNPESELHVGVNCDKPDNGIEISTTDIQTDDNDNSDETAPDENIVYSVTVPNNSTDTDIAKLLIDAKLIGDESELYSAIEEAGAEGKLKYGTFSIPAGSTALDIVKIMTS